jgi:hypothetical protein
MKHDTLAEKATTRSFRRAQYMVLEAVARIPLGDTRAHGCTRFFISGGFTLMAVAQLPR